MVLIIVIDIIDKNLFFFPQIIVFWFHNIYFFIKNFTHWFLISMKEKKTDQLTNQSTMAIHFRLKMWKKTAASHELLEFFFLFDWSRDNHTHWPCPCVCLFETFLYNAFVWLFTKIHYISHIYGSESHFIYGQGENDFLAFFVERI